MVHASIQNLNYTHPYNIIIMINYIVLHNQYQHQFYNINSFTVRTMDDLEHFHHCLNHYPATVSRQQRCDKEVNTEIY